MAWAALCLALCASPTAAQSLQLKPEHTAVELEPHLRYRHDPTGSRSPPEMLAAARENQFLPLPEGRAAFGFTRGAYWFHTRLFNDSTIEQRWLLVLSYPLIDHVDVHLRYPDGTWRTLSSGDRLPFSSRSVRYRHPNFWLDLPQRTEVDLLVRASSESSLQVPLALYTGSAFAEMERQSQFAIGMYDGVLLALFLYNLLLWLAIRDTSHLWYTFHVGAFGLMMFCLNGLAFETLWPASTQLANNAIPVSMALAQIAMHQFTRSFLNLRKRWPLGDRLSLILMTLLIALGIASPALDYRTAVIPLTLSVFPGAALILWQTVRSVREGYRPARLFLLAWSTLLMGTALYASVSLGILPKTFITEYGIQFGSALEIILLSFALAYRYANLRNENERLVREANDQLERGVAKRTSELTSALEQLADANSRLRESNRRDVLTGAFNRRHFHDVFEQLLRQSAEQRRALGVMLIDLDHFKQVNDTHGHLAGDECLRFLARRLSEKVNTGNAVVARFGGEEFAVVVPDAAPNEVLELAESLRQCIADSPVIYGDETIHLSASFGVYNVTPGVPTKADDALHRTDEALYIAKSRGRNCVVVATDPT